MNAELISELGVPRRRAWRARAVAGLGPLTALAALGWAVAQPYRVTLLHPHGQTLWWLLVEPPLLVALVGVLFHVVVARGLLVDLEEADDASG